MMMKTVELVPAHLWVCEDCGRDNFERGTRLEPESLDGEEARELAEISEETGIDFGGEYLLAPTRVKCRHCGSEFAATCGETED